MSRGLRRRLLAERAELVRTLARKLADDEADPAAEMARVERLDRALALLPPSRAGETVARLAVLAGCVAAVVLAWTVRIDALGLRTAFVASVATDTVGFALAAEPERGWSLRAPIVLPADGDLVIADAIVTFSDPGLADGLDGARTRLAIRAGELELQRLDLAPGAVLRLARRGPGSLEIGLAGAGSTGAVQFRGAGEVGLAGSGRAFDLVIPEIVHFEADAGAAAVATRLLVPLAETVVLERLLVARLSFASLAQAEAAAGDVFHSAIRQGTVELPQVGRDIELRLGDGLSLEGVDATIQRLEIGVDGPLSVTLSGTAERVVVTSHGFARDETPSLLVFILRHEPWAFFVGAVTSLSGIIWGLRRWI